MQVFTQMSVVVTLLELNMLVSNSLLSASYYFCFFWHSRHSQHLLRSRPYLVNLLPCLTRITKRQEETVQETLAAAMPKIMAALGNFANDSEIKVSTITSKNAETFVLGNLMSLL